jgi:dolichyl-phosphate beta-glucosyltransferase
VNQQTLLVIPAYRESLRLPVYLKKLLPALRESGLDIEVLVVDDGSGSEEIRALGKMLDLLRPAYPQLLPPLLLPVNLGKGAAIQAGWNQVRDHQLLAFVDADGSISASEFLRLLSPAGKEPRSDTALFACRIKMMGRRIERRFHRHLMGRVYATLIGILLEIPIYDSQCGLKIISRAAWDKIKPDLHERGFAFDVDLLLALLKHGYNIKEEPIDWQDIEGSKVHLLRDSLRMFRAVLRLRRRY